LGDGRALSSQHPSFFDEESGKPLCDRWLRGRCEAGVLCNRSHAPPEVEEAVIEREFEEVVDSCC
jgi:hypothetical protein